VFYWTHLLYIPFWVLLILHGPNFWYWFIGPGLCFALFKASRRIRLSSSNRGRTDINSAMLLPSRVTHLVIRKPENFYFHPGDYVYLKVPAITSTEWHPFTISSAPELPGRILSTMYDSIYCSNLLNDNTIKALQKYRLLICYYTSLMEICYTYCLLLFICNRFYMATYSMCWWVDQ
jgi:hypothetical protein